MNIWTETISDNYVSISSDNIHSAVIATIPGVHKHVIHSLFIVKSLSNVHILSIYTLQVYSMFKQYWLIVITNIF